MKCFAIVVRTFLTFLVLAISLECCSVWEYQDGEVITLQCPRNTYGNETLLLDAQFEINDETIESDTASDGVTKILQENDTCRLDDTTIYCRFTIEENEIQMNHIEIACLSVVGCHTTSPAEITSINTVAATPKITPTSTIPAVTTALLTPISVTIHDETTSAIPSIASSAFTTTPTISMSEIHLEATVGLTVGAVAAIVIAAILAVIGLLLCIKKTRTPPEESQC